MTGRRRSRPRVQRGGGAPRSVPGGGRGGLSSPAADALSPGS